jgi:hypothetical protein
VPAHPREAEHAWKDGDSWRRGGDDEAIVNTLTLECFGDAGGRGGVPGTQGGALCAIMEGAISKEKVT